MSTPHGRGDQLLRRLTDYQLNPAATFGLALLLVFIFAIGDLLTGPYLAFSTFYLLAVVFAAWFGGRAQGIAISIVAALCGVITTSIHPVNVPATAVILNGILRFVIYAFTAVVVNAEHSSQVRIGELSFSDPLTGLANRRDFYRRGEAELRTARRNGGPVALIYLDIDDLKVRNDTLGHHAGDAMLMEFATIARTSFRETDVLARVGGDEFCCLLPGLDLDAASVVIDRLESALGAAENGPINVSIGVVAGRPDDGSDLDSMLGNADSLMYQAKQAGKGQRRARASLGRA